MDKRIESIAFKRVVDENPDLSWLGEYDDRAALKSQADEFPLPSLSKAEKSDLANFRHFI